jgi:hypothetical protein
MIMAEYRYKDQKRKIFTDEGLEAVLRIRRKVEMALSASGAFLRENVKIKNVDIFIQFAVVDYLVEIEYLREVNPESTSANRCYVEGKRLKYLAY